MLLTCIKTTVGIKIFGADLIQRLGEQIERILKASRSNTRLQSTLACFEWQTCWRFSPTWTFVCPLLPRSRNARRCFRRVGGLCSHFLSVARFQSCEPT